jgi:glyoxylase-like metal-dependent hydrolase (beta-lactamase superfamily II)
MVGRARVSLINLGTLPADLADWLRVAPEHLTRDTARILGQPTVVPVLVALIELPETVVLVDACDVASLASHSPPGEPPADLLAQLAALGVAADRVEHVVLTHLHFDHFSGITRAQDGRQAACFPRAQHYVGRADWGNANAKRADPDSLEGQTLGVIERLGLLRLVDGDLELGGGVRILAAPGETPGHQIVRVSSEGQMLYCLGDLYHHPLEVEHSEWLVHWADPDTTRASRRRLADAALAENALLSATHIPGLGRLRRQGTGVRWNNA